MRYLLAVIAGYMVAASPAAAAVTDPVTALQQLCEPLIMGGKAADVADKARADGFVDDVVLGQRVLRKGELLVALSETPVVCLVQAPYAMTLEQGFALTDEWAKRRPGSVNSPATKGPDGRPARSWIEPKSSLSLVATLQHDGAGRDVMNFILAKLNVIAPTTNGSPPPSAEPGQWQAELDLKGWQIAARTNDALFLLQPADPAQADGKRRFRERLEQRIPARGVIMSGVSLVEFDCSGGRFRRLESTYFPGRNMTGLAVPEIAPPEWITPAPRTANAAVFTLACTGKRL